MLAPVIFCGDALFVVILAWRTVGLLERQYRGLVETTLSWILTGMVWVVGGGVVLGMAGGFSRVGFLGFHGASLAMIYFLRKDCSADVARAGQFLADWRRLLWRRSLVGAIAAGLIIGLVLLTAIASQAEPAVFDALTYRLSRIGQWLQDGRITSYSTDDPRINYMPVGPDIVIAWLLGATNEGFFLASWSQVIGGVLLAGATFGLARSVGLTRLAALGAVSLALGMANVAVQFTTIQSDLFTAGIFAASYLLWHRSVERKNSPIAGTIGIALAWGSKGTMFYLAPGAAIWAIWLIWKQQTNWRTLRPAVAAGILAGLLFVGPSYWRNVATYHSLFGPKEAVTLHHGPPLTMEEHFQKLGLNLKTSALQLLDPTAQPFWCRSALRDLGQKFLSSLPDSDDRYLFLHDFSRRLLVQGILQQTDLDADIASCGVLAVGLFVLGGIIAAWRWRDCMAAQIAIWCLGVWVYFLVQHALVQWHQWAFRFAVLVAPWMAVAGAYAISQVRIPWRPVLWVIVIISSGEITWRAQSETHQGAWQSLVRPDDGLPQFVYSHWHAWTEQLDPAGASLRVALPINSPLGAFYRTRALHLLSMEKLSTLSGETAEAAIAGKASWLIVPALKFMGREGAVMGFTFLYAGEGASANSFAAFRALRPGEIPRSIIYRAKRELTPTSFKRTMLVRFWKTGAILNLRNPGPLSWHYTVKTASQEIAGVLTAGENADVSLKVDAEHVSEIAIEMYSESATGAADGYPSAILVNP